MNRILVTFLFGLLLAGCGEDFLELTPISSPNVANFYRTENDLVNGVNAAYATLQSGNLYGGRDLSDLTEYRGDIAFDNDPSAGSGIRFNVDQFLAGATNEIIEDVWQDLYLLVYRTNIVLDRLPAVDTDAELARRLEGELRFLRGLAYFHLVRLWGPVPLVLTPDDPESSRTHVRNSVDEVYAAIEEDLSFAADNLPASYPPAEVGRATSGAARGLLAKVYLTRKNWGAAAGASETVIESGEYSLQPTIADVFDPTNEYNSEILFAVVFTATNPNEDHGYYFSSAIGDFIEPAYRASFTEGDQRQDMIELITPPGTATLVPAKYFEAPSSDNTVGTDFPVLRYADVLLMYAEALNEQGYEADGAASASLNAVRTRAGLPAYSTSDVPDQASFRDAVLRERCWELPLENQRWYDLLRTGRAISALAEVGLTIGQDDLLFPIPNSQVLIYNNPEEFPQNPGY
jgi:hypothetical protein